jgi:hypothetical protein
MTRLRLWLALLVLSATLIQCSSCRENVAPAFLLPPETQSGLGTYACLINGVAWQYKNPTGIFNLQTYTSWHYDPNDRGGALSIGGVRYDKNNVIQDQLNLHADSLGISKVAFANSMSQTLSIGYNNYQKLKANECSDYFTEVINNNSKNFFRQGKIELTKLDMQARIISGRFACTIYQAGCDTLKITDGRFDLKF